MYRKKNAVAPGDIVMTPTFHCVPCPGLIKRTEPLFCVFGTSTAPHNVIDPLSIGRYYGGFRFACLFGGLLPGRVKVLSAPVYVGSVQYVVSLLFASI